jgi:PAS domain-containing protein
VADRLLGPSSRPRADELAGVGTWSLDMASGRLTTNAAARRMLGWDDRQGLPTLHDFLAFVHPEDRELLTAHTDRLVREGQEYVLEHRALLPGGRVLHLRASATADLDEDGRVRMLHGVTLDVTSAYHLLHGLLSALSDGCLLVSGGRVVEVNAALCVLTGFSADELVGSRAPYPFWPDGRELQEVAQADVEAVRKDGRPLALSATVLPRTAPDSWLVLLRERGTTPG